MRTAFKEWAVIVDALGGGAQIIILRKGGIREDGGAFKPEHDEFFLFPTLFHQQRDSVLSSAQTRYDQILPRYQDKSTVRIEYFASVSAIWHLADLSRAQRLRGLHVWRDEIVAQRFDWGREKSIYAMAVRVFRLLKPLLLPFSPAYAGCKSWVNLEVEPDTTGSIPVLDDASYHERMETFQLALGPEGRPL